MRHAKPLVSIVTPSYNQGRFLEETLRSVREQDYPNLEHIVIEDGSTDQSCDILQRYEGAYNFRWYPEPHSGQAAAIRKGFERSQGQILAWLNSDDVYLPGAITTVVEAFRRHPRAALIYGDVHIIDAESRVYAQRRLTTLDRYDFLGQGNCLAQPATFWTRAIYEEVGGVDARWYFQMDLDFFIRVAAAGRLQHVRALLAKIRIHPDGKMSKADHIRRQELAQLQQCYLTDQGWRRLLYARQVLLAKQYLRYVLQGDVAYATEKVWQRLKDRDLFRESRS